MTEAECPVCHGTGKIGTTDWLTKNMSAKQLAKEKEEAVAEFNAKIRAEAINAREEFNIVVSITVFTGGVNIDKLGTFLSELLFRMLDSFLIRIENVDFELIALVLENAKKKLKVCTEHIGHEDRIILLHLFSEFHSLHYACTSLFLASHAAKRLRRRIFTAPRLVISSIFICV